MVGFRKRDDRSGCLQSFGPAVSWIPWSRLFLRAVLSRSLLAIALHALAANFDCRPSRSQYLALPTVRRGEQAAYYDILPL